MFVEVVRYSHSMLCERLDKVSHFSVIYLYSFFESNPKILFLEQLFLSSKKEMKFLSNIIITYKCDLIKEG